MWPDNETANDLIGYQVHADLIRTLITNGQMLPTTVGIFGDWGGGKTSIMKMLERDLEPDRWPKGSVERAKYDSTAVVYVNTWLFEGYDDAKAAILSSVLLELSENKRFGPTLRDVAMGLIRSVRWLRIGRLAMKHLGVPAAAAFFTAGAGAIPEAIALSAAVGAALPTGKSATEEEKSPEWKEKLEGGDLFKNGFAAAGDSMDVRTFRERFGKMLADAGITNLVVLVDDLDRCTPDRIIDNLEAVKLFLSVPQTAFVIGADRRIVEHAIRNRYAEKAIDPVNDEETKRLVKDYLEKLVQVPYSLPRMSASEIESYMTLLFCQLHLTADEFATCSAACNEARMKNRYSSFGFGGVRAALKAAELQPTLEAALSASAASAPLIADGLKGNPRQVKRFLNAFLLRKELARVAKLENIGDAVLVKLMILEYVNTELFTQLFNWQSQQTGHPSELAALESSLAPGKGDPSYEETAKKIDARWSTTSARKWIAMAPPLRSVDLRDYFWVARDRLESTFAGVSMMPPAVRAVLDGLMAGTAPKRNAAVKSSLDLGPDERSVLVGAIEQRVAREPSELAGYEAIFSLVEADMAEAVQGLAKILTERPLEPVPPTVGMRFMTLYKAKPAFSPSLDPAKELLEKSTAKVGKAAQSAKKT